MSHIESFGHNSSFALGTGSKDGNFPSPVAATYVGGNVVEAATSYHTQVARLSNGTLRAVGGNTNGELGDGTHESKAQGVDPGLRGIVEISSAGAHTLARDDAGRVHPWGGNAFGTLGNGVDGGGTEAVPPGGVPAGSPVPLLLDLPRAARVCTGGPNSGVVLCDGTCLLWGENRHGQCGDGTKQLIKNVPTIVPGIVHAVDMAIGGLPASGTHTLILLSDGTVLACGSNGQGQLGLGMASAEVLTPTPIPGLTDVVAIAAGASQSAAIRSDGSLVVWGSNQRGQLGLGPTVLSVTTPTKLIAANVEAVSCGLQYTLALVNGSVVSFGRNDYGQLGDGTLVDKLEPVTLPWIGNVSQIDTGEYFSVVVVEGAEPPPPEVTVTEGVGSVRLDWTAKSEHQWFVNWHENLHPEPPQPWPNKTLPSTANTCEITGLKSGQQYEVTLRSSGFGVRVFRPTPK